jgi:zinc transporter ZupT
MVELILPLFFVGLTFFSTLMGGLFVLRNSSLSVKYFFAFAAGTLIGVSFFDILPEAMNIGRETNFDSIFITGTIVLSFFLFHILDRAIVIHAIPLGHSSKEDQELGARKAQVMSGSVRAAGLSIHSFLDGVAIGTAFHIGVNVGVVIGLAVIFHDFSDGLNTVTVLRRAGAKGGPSLVWLLVDALTPIAGALASLVLFLSPEALAVMLAFFVGEFVFIAASDLLPEAHRIGTSYRVVLASALGVLLILTVTRFLNV